MDIGATLDALFALSNPVPLRVREILEDHAVVVDLPPGHTLFVVGDTARHAYLIHSGQVSEWRDEALLQTWTKGDVAGDMAAHLQRTLSQVLPTQHTGAPNISWAVTKGSVFTVRLPLWTSRHLPPDVHHAPILDQVAEDGWLLVAEAGHLGTSGQPDDAHRTGGAG